MGVGSGWGLGWGQGYGQVKVSVNARARARASRGGVGRSTLPQASSLAMARRPTATLYVLGFVAMGVESVVALSGEFVKLRAVCHAGLQPRTTSRQGPRQVA